MQFLVNFFVGIIDKVGYAGVCFLMVLESMIFPVPSEAVMPFAGFLWQAGRFSFWPVLIWSLVGALIGSLISYFVGFYGGRPFVARFGKYFLLNEHHLEMTENFFNKHGEVSVFLCRLIPVVRHFISIPAGAGRMKLWKFIFYTLIGAALWHTILIFTGYYLGQNWELIQKYFDIINIAVVIAIVCVIIFLYGRRNKV